MPEEPLSGFTQSILRMAWRLIFKPGTPLFLPDKLRRELDPLMWAGPTPLVTVPVDPSTADAACMRDGVAHNPVASAPPTLQLMHVRISGLYAIEPVSTGGDDGLTFSKTAPELTAKLRTGVIATKATPLVIESDGKTNYQFAVACCVPLNESTRDCSGERFTAQATGKLRAQVSESDVAITLRVAFPKSGKDAPQITVRHVAIAVEQSKVRLDFGVDSLDPAFVDLAEMTVELGIAAGAVQDTLSLYFDSDEFKTALGKLLTDQLAAALPKS